MSASSLTPGKSLESDLRLIREARGLSREDIFNRVHIRPEVLTQVEEQGFSATPTLSSDIHRRSFVKHYADAVEIDSEIALNALDKSLNGFYDGSLAVEYLGLAELTPVPRWAQKAPMETNGADAEEEPDVEVQAQQHAAEAHRAPGPTASDPPAPAVERQAEPSVQSDPEFNVVAEPPVDVAAAEASVEEASTSDDTEQEGDKETREDSMPELEVQVPEDAELSGESESGPSKVADTAPLPRSPYAPPMPGTVVEPAADLESSAPEASSKSSPPVEASPATEERPQSGADVATDDPPAPTTETPERRRREAATIPSSILKESVIGPPDEEDFGDEETLWDRLRGRHWLGWLGLTGVAIAILFFIGQAILGTGPRQARRTNGIANAVEMPRQFSGIVRLSPTTERFVTLQIYPADSVETTSFTYKMWTHSAGSTFAEVGEGSLNGGGAQILLGEPYGVGGLFVMEGGEVRLRSVRRVRFPRWEFTGHKE